jgi:hypothetical protein
MLIQLDVFTIIKQELQAETFVRIRIHQLLCNHFIRLR